MRRADRQAVKRAATRPPAGGLLCTVILPLTLAAPAHAQQSETPDDEAVARQAGTAAANSFSGGWFGRGVAGGLILGPIGTGVAFVLAGRSDVEIPAAHAQELDRMSPLYSRAFRQAYEEQARMKRKESAFVGGMLGTAVWTWALLRAVDLIGGAEFDGDTGPPDPGF